jgi:hypothetical protein
MQRAAVTLAEGDGDPLLHRQGLTLQATLKQRLRSLAPGMTPRSVLDKMVDVHLPTTDGCTVILSRLREPKPALLLERLKISLPDQPPPRLMSDGTPISK